MVILGLALLALIVAPVLVLVGAEFTRFMSGLARRDVRAAPMSPRRAPAPFDGRLAQTGGCV